METLRVRPEVWAWWESFRALAEGPIGRVHCWQVSEAPPPVGPDTEQHGVVTLVLCLHGRARIDDGQRRCDLQAGDALVLAPGVWHRHDALRAGSVVYQQGFIAGRSDFFLVSNEVQVVATVPEQPSRRLLHTMLTADADSRQALLQRLITAVRSDPAEPLSYPHPALYTMELTMWKNLHRPQVIDVMIEASGLSRSQVYRLVTSYYRMGLASLVRRERMRLAQELLCSSLQVREVQERCGFRHRQSFIRSFVEATGVTPSAWRSQALNE